MPNITIYLDNVTYSKFVVAENQKEIKDKCANMIKESMW